MDIKNAQKTVDNWIKNHGVGYFNILTNMILLVEEVGEVARIIARHYGQQSIKNNTTIDKITNLSSELSDVLFVLICLANQTNIDLEKSFYKNIILKTNRDKYRHINNKKLN